MSDAPTIKQIQAGGPEDLWHFLSQVPASFEAQLFLALILSGGIGMIANFVQKWARGEISGGLVHYLFIDNVRGTVLSFCGMVGLAIAAIGTHVFVTQDLVFVGWKAVLWFGVTNGFTADAIANKSTRPVWSEEKRATTIQPMKEPLQ